jgi:putative transposase
MLQEESVLQYRRYTWKLYPTREQAATLHTWRIMLGELWNGLLERVETVYSREGRTLSAYDLGKEITELRRECPEWKVMPWMTEAMVADHLYKAFQSFFRRMKELDNPGYPRRKDKRHSTTIPLGVMETKPPLPGEARTGGKNGWLMNQKDRLSWRLHVKGITRLAGVNSEGEERLHLRGELPCNPERFRNANILWRDGRWWLSVCVEIDCSREAGSQPLTVRFDLIDDFAAVNGAPEILPGLIKAKTLGRQIDDLKSERDLRFPKGKHLSDDEKTEKRLANRKIAGLYGKASRVTRECLHEWTSDLISRAGDLTIIAPDIRAHTQTPHGNEKSWGANTQTVSELNRHVLGQCPGMAIQMLQYKAAEAKIRCDLVRDEAPNIGVGADLVTVGKHIRRAKRKIRKEEKDGYEVVRGNNPETRPGV